jgi:hypothetical protein
MYHNLLRYFSRNPVAYDYYDAVKHKCRGATRPLYFNAELARYFLMSSSIEV